jgi:hypothetical protein
MLALPCKPNKWGDNNNFSQALRVKFAGTNGIVAQLATLTKLKKCLISKALAGKAIISSVAIKIAKALGYAVEDLFGVLPVEIPIKKRSNPTYLRIIMKSMPEPVSDRSIHLRATAWPTWPKRIPRGSFLRFSCILFIFCYFILSLHLYEDVANSYFLYTPSLKARKVFLIKLVFFFFFLI